MTEMFWMFLITTMVTFLGLLIGALYKSKCTTFSFSLTNGIQFQRAVDVEQQEDHEERQMRAAQIV